MVDILAYRSPAAGAIASSPARWSALSVIPSAAAFIRALDRALLRENRWRPNLPANGSVPSESRAQQGIGDETDAQLAGQRQEIGPRIARPQRVLGLKRVTGCTAYARESFPAPLPTDRYSGSSPTAPVPPMPRWC